MPQLNQARGPFIEVDGFAMGGLFAREGEKGIMTRLAARLLSRAAFPGREGLRAQVVVGTNESRETLDHEERVVELMGHAEITGQSRSSFGWRSAKLFVPGGPAR